MSTPKLDACIDGIRKRASGGGARAKFKRYKPGEKEIRARIDTLTRKIPTITPKGQNKQIASLCDLYYTIESLDRTLKRKGASIDRGEKELLGMVCHALAEYFRCTISVLPRELEKIFGVGMTAHGVQKDCQPNYLDQRELEESRVTWKGALAYWQDKPLTTHKLYGPDTVGRLASGSPAKHVPFVLSMAREFYIHGEHSPGYRYHSTYFSGAPVMCSGTIEVEAGKVKAISNASGHYAPSKEHLVFALKALLAHGVELADVDVLIFTVEDPSKPASLVTEKAEAFLSTTSVGLWNKRSRTEIAHFEKLLYQQCKKWVSDGNLTWDDKDEKRRVALIKKKLKDLKVGVGLKLHEEQEMSRIINTLREEAIDLTQSNYNYPERFASQKDINSRLYSAQVGGPGYRKVEPTSAETIRKERLGQKIKG